MSLFEASSKTSAFISTGHHSFFSRFVLSTTIIVFLVGFCPYVSSSPTSSSAIAQKNKQLNDEQTTFTGDSSLLSSAVQQSLPKTSSFRYAQPRAHANQFLMSHTNDNEIIVPQWLAKLHKDDQANNRQDDSDDYAPPTMFFNKRSTSASNGGYSNLKKRKQLNKPPMEVMNEIVNSIYLKR